MSKKVVPLTMILFILLFGPFPGPAQKMYEAKKDSVKVPRQPYWRYFTKDQFDREISFYISETSSATNLPLIVYIQGSGANSHFIKKNGQVIPVNGHIYLYESLQGKARLLIVEKPGVKYLDDPGPGAMTKNSGFNQQHSLERWAEAIKASVKAVIRSGLADSSRILVVGHSEGGLVACKVANDMGQLVTHAAILAGGGDSQLYDILTLARKGNFFMSISDDASTRVRFVLDEWEKIKSDPFNTAKFFFGFTYLRWSSFMKTSCLEQLEGCHARIFIAQGMKDENLDPVSADQLYAHLLSKNKNVTYDRLENADHSFNEKDNPDFNGWKAEMDKILTWFLAR
ncbi:MAG TPA: alpha/beta hydrolase-fold protein [Chitinophagaceae bacterium]|jgi:predicted esterase|nr:alpha/beta hydrolase-fold protein [Chitinophagaceae bacterium]